MPIKFELEKLIDVEDGEVLGYFTKCHIYTFVFFQAVTEEYGGDPDDYNSDNIRQEWWRTEDCEYDSNKEFFFKCLQSHEGAYPVTVIYL
ncbi:MAG: hypothetical protein PUP93_29120 [Rhizonema sp. NSF051]|nr:hypothetical protein [Rhizonema sp. NSF051]